MILLNEYLIGKVPSILHETEELLFSLPETIESITYGHAKKCVKLSLFYLTIFIKGLVLSHLDKLEVFRWVGIAHRLWLICSCAVMKDTS